VRVVWLDQSGKDTFRPMIFQKKAPSLSISIYYAGYDPGSGTSSLFASPEEDLKEILTISAPSFIADGNLAELANMRGHDLDASPASCLKENEYALSIEEAGKVREYYMGDLALKQGSNADDALADPDRYWSKQFHSHSRIRLLGLAAACISEDRFELRLVTALPVSLYKLGKEYRARVKEALQGTYRFDFNGRQKEITIKVGAVIMEGIGALIAVAEEGGEGEIGIIDIGRRTVDLVAAEDKSPMTRFCAGDPDLGVSRIVEELTRVILQQYKRRISPLLANDLLSAYAHDERLPEVSTADANVPPDRLHAIIRESIVKQGRAINTFISKVWNQEGSTVGANYRAVYLVGGGAYYFAESIRQIIQKAVVPTLPEEANVRGYLDLCLGLEAVKPTIWG
jgi:hypothetical protein